MQQPQLTTYIDIGEVQTLTSAVRCNQLLAEGWVLLGVDSIGCSAHPACRAAGGMGTTGTGTLGVVPTE
jgi:hypothetical protein